MTQDWTLDQLGNWNTFRQDDDANGTWELDQDRTHNSANEIGAIAPNGGIPGWIDPAYDAAGNMTTMPQPLAPNASYLATYDAWNRLVIIKNGPTVVQTNRYDALNRRIQKIIAASNTTYDFYYNLQWQVLTEAKNGVPEAIYSYHPYYVDAPAVRMRINDEHLYLQDANFNVTAVVDIAGAVVERYAYTPYGEVTVLDADFSAVTGNTSAIGNELLYTGRRLDPETGLQLNRNRFYASHLGRWVNRDPIGFFGGSNLYEYVESRPLVWLDPSGEFGGVGIGIGIGIGIWLGSQSGCDVPPLEMPPEPQKPNPPNQPKLPRDRGPDGPCEGNSNMCCNKGNDTFNRPNPKWPFPGMNKLPIPGQGGAITIAKSGGCASCNKGKSNFIEKCESCCGAVAGGTFAAQANCKLSCQNAAR